MVLARPQTFDEAQTLRHKARLCGMNPNYWYPAAFSKDLKKGAVEETHFWGDSIALFRGEDGVAAALENRCAHRHIPLTLGHVRGCNITCLYHGWSFDRAGKLVRMAHDDFGKKLPAVKVRRYPVKERYGFVWFFPGDPELAARVALPEIPFAEGPDRWASLSFAYTWKAHHSMVIDNLCNLTHLYVHGNWVPYGPTTLADGRLEGERITLLWRHELRKDILHPLMAPIFRKEKGSNLSDTEIIYDYPYQRALSNERVRSCNFMLPIDAGATRVFSIQLWKAPRVPGLGKGLPPGLMQLGMPFIRPITKEIFRQDGATVEAEYAALDEHFDRPVPEVNHSVRLFDKLSVERWEAYARGDGAPGSAAKVL